MFIKQENATCKCLFWNGLYHTPLSAHYIKNILIPSVIILLKDKAISKYIIYKGLRNKIISHLFTLLQNKAFKKLNIFFKEKLIIILIFKKSDLFKTDYNTTLYIWITNINNENIMIEKSET